MNPIDEALVGFADSGLTTRVCTTIFGALPFTPGFEHYSTLDGAARRLGADASGLDRARALAARPGVARALRVAAALDTADAGLAAVSGVRTLFAWISGAAQARRRFESNREQAIDAVVKLCGLGYVASLLVDGPAAKRLQAIVALPAGREALTYYALAELALPFSDEALGAGGAMLDRLLATAGPPGAESFAAPAGGQTSATLALDVEAVKAPLAGLLGQVAPHTEAVSARLRQLLPAALGVADSVTSAIATGLDALPIWRLLIARLAAECCVRRAVDP